MLGIWAALSPMAWRWRLIGLVAGGAYLDGLLVVAGFGHDLLRLPMAFMASLATTGLLLLARRPGVRLIRISPPPGDGKGPRFSIRGLMLLTLVAALLIFGSGALGDSYPAVLVAWISCFVLVGWASPWAALGLGPSSARCFLVLAVSACARGSLHRPDLPGRSPPGDLRRNLLGLPPPVDPPARLAPGGAVLWLPPRRGAVGQIGPRA